METTCGSPGASWLRSYPGGCSRRSLARVLSVMNQHRMHGRPGSDAMSCPSAVAKRSSAERIAMPMSSRGIKYRRLNALMASLAWKVRHQQGQSGHLGAPGTGSPLGGAVGGVVADTRWAGACPKSLA